MVGKQMHFLQITCMPRDIDDFHELLGVHAKYLSLYHPLNYLRICVIGITGYIQGSIELLDQFRVEWCLHGKQTCQILSFDGLNNVLETCGICKASEIELLVAK